MKKFISALCIALSIIALALYFVRTSQISTITDFTGFLLFAPTLLAIPELIFANLANKEQKDSFAIILIVCNAIFLLSIPLIHFLGNHFLVSYSTKH